MKPLKVHSCHVVNSTRSYHASSQHFQQQPHFPCRAALAGMGQPTSILPLKPVGPWSSNVKLITWTLTTPVLPNRARREVHKLATLFQMNTERLWLLRRFPNTEIMKMEVMLVTKANHLGIVSDSKHTWSWKIRRNRHGEHVWGHLERQCCGITGLQTCKREMVKAADT